MILGKDYTAIKLKAGKTLSGINIQHDTKTD